VLAQGTGAKPGWTERLMREFSTLTFEVRGRVAVVVLNRPDDANCVNDQMAEELLAAAVACDVDAAVKAVVLTGTGRFFCAGGDVKAMSAFGDDMAEKMKSIADQLHRAISTFSRMRAPLVVAVNGIAAGAGFSLAAAGDIVVASDTASFTMAYGSVGLSPDGSSSYFLPRLIGLRRTEELMLTPRKLTAAEALEYGLVTRVVPGCDLMDATLDLARSIAEGSGSSNAAVKSLLLETFSNGLETQMELEGRLVAQCARSPDGREGIRAFVEKRSPRFD
jgi:2-(1,2-epoxy-1,2-dihydrophenyl)acetyl-CoA isomerase